MSIKSSDQISIVDVTDAYSVILTNDSHVFPGTTSAAVAGSSATTQIIAMRGGVQIPAFVDLSACIKPDAIKLLVDTDTTAPTLTITVDPDKTLTTDGVIKIPVKLENKTITIVKNFTFAIAFTGKAGAQGTQGPQGEQGQAGKDGVDAITMSITSSAGTIFKNSSISTVLTAHVYKAGVEVTDATALSALGTIKWYKDGVTTSTVATGTTLTISSGDVTNKAIYLAQLE